MVLQVEIAEGEAPPRPETVDEDQIAELVEQNLAEKLTILPEVELAQALHDYVDKVASMGPSLSSLPRVTVSSNQHRGLRVFLASVWDIGSRQGLILHARLLLAAKSKRA